MVLKSDVKPIPSFLWQITFKAEISHISKMSYLFYIKIMKAHTDIYTEMMKGYTLHFACNEFVCCLVDT